MKYPISFEKIKRILFSVMITLALLFSAEYIYAANGSTNQQKITISGTVTSSNTNQGLPGVSIAVKGTSLGTVTDSDGRYSISVPSDVTLLFSFIGYTTQEIQVKGKTTVNVALAETT